jgi:LmbE family N-acetylglucosaminyl deacetylase
MKPSATPVTSSGLWVRLADPATGLPSGKKIPWANAVFLVAHPDDEAISASAALGRFGNSTVVFLTDGAPRDPRFWPAGETGSRADYARTRRDEAHSALALAAIPPDRILFLGATDQDATLEAGTLAERFAFLLRQLRPNLLITHPYEGGHPDHDAAALVAFTAVRLLRAAGESEPEMLEMTSYYVAEGGCVTGEFLPEYLSQVPSTPQLTIHLSPQELATKQNMLARYQSQKLVLEGFLLEPERLRLAPRYDFAQPPHPGKLWYECLAWPMTGERWRELAVNAFPGLKDKACG